MQSEKTHYNRKERRKLGKDDITSREKETRLEILDWPKGAENTTMKR